MLQFLVKGKTKKKRQFSFTGPNISRKNKEKAKEDEPHTLPRSTIGEEHEEHDNHSKFSHHHLENSKQEYNPHVSLIESFQNQLNAPVHKNDLQEPYLME